MIFYQTSENILAETVEWMRSPYERCRGLLKFPQCPIRYAAIFPLPGNGIFPLIHTFGMKFPIDLVFCNAHKNILFVAQAVMPFRLVIPWEYLWGGCSYLIEFAGCQLPAMKVGDQLLWENV